MREQAWGENAKPVWNGSYYMLAALTRPCGITRWGESDGAWVMPVRNTVSAAVLERRHLELLGVERQLKYGIKHKAALIRCHSTIRLSPPQLFVVLRTFC